MEEEDVPIPSKGYDLSFLDNLDDPNFDPFKTKSTVSNDISSKKKSRPALNKPKIQNDRISDVKRPNSKSPRIERGKVTSSLNKDSTLGNKDKKQSDEDNEEVPISNNTNQPKDAPVTTKPKPMRSDTFKVKANENDNTVLHDQIQNQYGDTIAENVVAPSLEQETSGKKKLSRSGTFTKSDTDEASDSQAKDETKDMTKTKGKPKKTILSKLMIKSQRKMVRSKTISNIELDNVPQTPKSPSLDIDALLESIHSSKVSEAANVFEFLETSNEDDEQKTPRKMSIDTSSYVVSPDFSIDEGLLTPRRMSIDTNSYVVPADFSSEETNTPKRQNFDTSSYVVSSDFSNNAHNFAQKDDGKGIDITDERLTHSLSNLNCGVTRYGSSSSINSNVEKTRNGNDINSCDSNFQMKYGKDSQNDNYDRNNMDQLEKMKSQAQKLRDQISDLKDELSQLNRNEDLIESFKSTINELLSSREISRVYYEVEKDRISHEKSQLVDDLVSAENSYKDVKGKYERSRDLIIRYKADEDNLKVILKDRMDKLKEKEQRFERLKCHAEDKVQQANDAISQIQTSGEVEMARLTTMLRKSELKVETLDQTMRQKSEESRELAKMCDELICCAQAKPRYTL